LIPVDQLHVETSLQDTIPATISLLTADTIASPSSKCIVFFPTARAAALAAEVLRRVDGLPPVLEIHSRRTQGARTKASGQFKVAQSAILVSSDVAARGVDFPGFVQSHIE
jgi:ATP-dependent RNA helicase MSS116